MRKRYLPLSAALLLLAASPVLAQPVSNPSYVEFTASPDHNAAFVDGLPKLTRYELRFFAVGSDTPIATTDLGKPTPNTLGKIRFLHDFSAVPLNVLHVARVAAIGPGGVSESAISNEFIRVQYAAPAPPTGLVIGKQ